MEALSHKEEEAEHQRRTRPKGERSRQAILDAALVVIAKRGLHNVTHRAIAAEADVPLSLTTYFFKSLSDIVEQSFDYFTEAARSEHSRMLADLRAYLAPFSPKEVMAQAEIRLAIRDEISRQLTDFIVFITRQHSVGVAVELNFLHHYRFSPGLQPKVEAYRKGLVMGVADLLRPLMPDPEFAETDASLIVGTVHRLEFECMNGTGETPCAAKISRELSRQLGFIVGIR